MDYGSTGTFRALPCIRAVLFYSQMLMLIKTNHFMKTYTTKQDKRKSSTIVQKYLTLNR